MPRDTIEHDLPESWASALINADFSGLDFEECVQVLHFQRTHNLRCAQTVAEEAPCIGKLTYIWII